MNPDIGKAKLSAVLQGQWQASTLTMEFAPDLLLAIQHLKNDALCT